MSNPGRDLVKEWAMLQKVAGEVAEAQRTWESTQDPQSRAQVESKVNKLSDACTSLEYAARKIVEASKLPPSPAVQTMMWMTGLFGRLKVDLDADLAMFDGSDDGYYIDLRGDDTGYGTSERYESEKIREVAPLFRVVFGGLHSVVSSAVDELVAMTGVTVNT